MRISKVITLRSPRSPYARLAKSVRAFAIFAFVIFIGLASSACTVLSDDTQKLHYSGTVPEDNVFILSEKAQSAYARSHWIEAVQLYQRVVERVPGDADAWFRLGNTYAQQGAYERAIHAYETSLINDSQQPKAWFNLSTAYLLKAQTAMRRSYERMRSNDPARALIDARLIALGEVLHGRIEESGMSGLHTSR